MTLHQRLQRCCTAALLVAALVCATATARADVILYRWAQFTDGYDFSESCTNIGDYVRSYWDECTQTYGRGENTRTVPCIKTASLNDDFRAIVITTNETVEVYEHKNFGGRFLRYRGPARAVFPAWFWDKASSIAVYRSR